MLLRELNEVEDSIWFVVSTQVCTDSWNTAKKSEKRTPAQHTAALLDNDPSILA
jgi:hypothetical protein